MTSVAAARHQLLRRRADDPGSLHRSPSLQTLQEQADASSSPAPSSSPIKGPNEPRPANSLPTNFLPGGNQPAFLPLAQQFTPTLHHEFLPYGWTASHLPPHLVPAADLHLNAFVPMNAYVSHQQLQTQQVLVVTPFDQYAVIPQVVVQSPQQQQQPTFVIAQHGLSGMSFGAPAPMPMSMPMYQHQFQYAPAPTSNDYYTPLPLPADPTIPPVGTPVGDPAFLQPQPGMIMTPVSTPSVSPAATEDMSWLSPLTGLDLTFLNSQQNQQPVIVPSQQAPPELLEPESSASVPASPTSTLRDLFSSVLVTSDKEVLTPPRFEDLFLVSPVQTAAAPLLPVLAPPSPAAGKEEQICKPEPEPISVKKRKFSNLTVEDLSEAISRSKSPSSSTSTTSSDPPSPNLDGSEPPLKKKSAPKKRPRPKPAPRDLICPVDGCGKLFNRMYNLQVHQLAHSGQRSHACDECPLTFARLHDLRRHARCRHSKEKPYACVVEGCGEAFPRADALQRHIAMKHHKSA
ncbi:hypothetical protein HDU67_003599 [Dinochytrium kinnereticum]|nr:hypothetical protein HDU67_003599 [Dinochytrium kinnereticum]